MKWTHPQSCQIEGKNTKPLKGMKDEISFISLSLIECLLSGATNISRINLSFKKPKKNIIYLLPEREISLSSCWEYIRIIETPIPSANAKIVLDLTSPLNTTESNKASAFCQVPLQAHIKIGPITNCTKNKSYTGTIFRKLRYIKIHMVQCSAKVYDQLLHTYVVTYFSTSLI